jgi:hypothetical protein
VHDDTLAVPRAEDRYLEVSGVGTSRSTSQDLL